MTYYCKVCKQTISERVYDFSMNHFGKSLCIPHQRELKHQKLLCSICKQAINQKVYDYSTSHYGRPLCWEHQKNAIHEKAITTKMQPESDGSYRCYICKTRIHPKVYRYSVYNYDRPLCRDCQPPKERIRSRTSSNHRKRELNKPSPIEFGGKIPKGKKYYNGY